MVYMCIYTSECQDSSVHAAHVHWCMCVCVCFCACLCVHLHISVCRICWQRSMQHFICSRAEKTHGASKGALWYEPAESKLAEPGFNPRIRIQMSTRTHRAHNTQLHQHTLRVNIKIRHFTFIFKSCLQARVKPGVDLFHSKDGFLSVLAFLQCICGNALLTCRKCIHESLFPLLIRAHRAFNSTKLACKRICKQAVTRIARLFYL